MVKEKTIVYFWLIYINFHRNSIKEALKKINPNDDDIVLISDIDEIWDDDILNRLKNNQVSLIHLKLYYKGGNIGTLNGTLRTCPGQERHFVDGRILKLPHLKKLEM